MRQLIALALGLLTLAAGLACAEPAWAPTLRPPPTAPPAALLTPPTILPPPTFRPAPLPPAATAPPPPTPSPVLSPPPEMPTPPAIAPTPTPPPLPTATVPPPARPTPRTVAPTPAPPSATIPPPAGYAALPNTAHLAQQNPAAAQSIQALPWVADGIAAAERDAAAALVNIAIGQDDLLNDLLAKPWVRDGGDFKELGAALAGLNTLSVWAPADARRIAAMPFLDSLEPADAAALTVLSQLVSGDRPAFGEVMSHPTLQAGIGDESAKIVAVLAGVNWTNPDLTPTLLNFAQTTLEERTVALPRAGPITLAIIRTEPGAAGSMDLLEQAVRFAEDYMGETFPRRYVAVLFGPATPAPFAGANFGTHIAIRPEYDRADTGSRARTAGRVIAHEVAHYYWDVKVAWLDEGAAEFMAAAFEEQRAGDSLMPNHYPCGRVKNLRDLAAMDYKMGAPGYQCNYALGERLFLDLRQALGPEDFRQGFRQLYRDIHAIDREPGIAEVRAAFQGDAAAPTGQMQTAIVDLVIARWYDGDKPYPQRHRDTRPVANQLPAVNGQVDRAYLSLTPDGPATHRFPAAAANGWGWLTVHYSYNFSGDPQPLELEVVEYYADGFAYRRVKDTVLLSGDGYGGARRYSVGQRPGREWTPGRYWIYVYHQGIKVAEVAYEVTE